MSVLNILRKELRELLIITMELTKAEKIFLDNIIVNGDYIQRWDDSDPVFVLHKKLNK